MSATERAGGGPLVVAIDSSTSATKAVVVNKEGEVLVTTKRDIELLTPQMNYYEHDPRQWWQTTSETIAEAIGALSDEQRARVAAIGITHQRESFAAVRADGEPIRPAILWLDSRAADQILAHGSDEIHELSGKPADTTPALYKMIWLKENEPETFAKADKVVDVHAYLSWALTGRWVSSKASVDTLALFDISKLDYSPRLLELAGVTREQMPDLAQPGEIIGNVKADIAASWGIEHDIAVVAGLGDGQAAGLGAAAIDSDTAYLNVGTSVVSGVHADTYRYGREYRTLAAGIPGHFVLEIVQNSGSHLTNWFREALGDPALEGRLDPALDEAAANVAPGCEGLLTMPYWNAVQSPHWSPIARGAMVGWGGNHTRGHAYRSIMEGIAYELRYNLAGMQRGTGQKLKVLRSMGGGQRNPLWNQILADVTGLPLQVSEVQEVSAQGAAVLAMVAIGAHPDVATASRAMARLGTVTEPNMELHARYAVYADIQAELYPALAQTFEKLYRAAKELEGR